MMQDSSDSASAMSIYTKVIQDLQDCVAELKKEYEDGGGFPVTDDHQALHKLCVKLEYLFQAGLKQKSGLLGGKKDYWNYISDCISSNKGLSDGIHFVKGISALKTNLGRGRALVRFCLMHQRLADTLQQCLQNPRTTGDWYQPQAVWFQHMIVSELVNSLYDLNSLQFDLDSRGHDLDAAWPTFARRNLGGGGSWRPPSRTTSINSLSMDSVYALPSSPRFNSTLFRQQGDETDAPESLPSIGQSQSVTLELQRECDTYKQRVEKMTESQQQKDTAHEKEVDTLKSRMKEMEDLLEEVNVHLDEQQKERSEASNNEQVKAQMVEMQDKIALLDKHKKALEIKLQSAELTITAKDKVDQKKVQLIEMLDKKISHQDRECSELHKSIDILLEDKKKLGAKLGEAAGQLEKMMSTLTENTKSKQKLQEENLQLKESQASCKSQLSKLVETMEASDHMRTELQKHNKELTQMLNELESKSQKIGSMAKEKVLKFKTQSELQQVEITTLLAEIQKHEEKHTQMETRVREVEEALVLSRGDVMGHVREMIDTMDSASNNQEQFALLGQKLDSLKEVSRSLSKEESLELSLKASETLNSDIKKEMLQLRTELQEQESSVVHEREELQTQLTKLEAENTKTKSVLQSKETQLHSIGAELNEAKAMLAAGGSTGGSTDANKQLAEELQIKSEEINSLKQGLEALNDTKETRGRDLDRMVKLQAVNTELLEELKKKDEYLQDLIKQMHLMKKFMESYKAKVEKLEADSAENASDKEPQTADLTGQLKQMINTLISSFPPLPGEETEMGCKDGGESHNKLNLENVVSANDETQVMMQMERQLHADEDKCTALQCQLSEFKQQFDQSEKNLQDSEYQNIIYKKQHEDNLAKLQMMEQDCLNAKNESAIEVANSQKLHEHIKMLEEQNQIQYLQHDESQKTVILLKEELHRLQEECDNYDSEMRSLRLELAIVTQNKAEIELQCEDGAQREEKLKSDLSNLNKKNEVLLGVELMLQEQLEALEREIKQMAIDKCQETEKNDMTVESMQGLSTERDSMQQEIMTSQSKIDDLQLHVKILEKKLSDYEDEAPIIALEKENGDLREQLQKILTEKSAMCAELTEKNAVLEEEINRLSRELSGSAKETDSSVGKIQKLDDLVNKLQVECEGKAEAIATLLSNMELMGKEVAKMRTQGEEKDSEIAHQLQNEKEKETLLHQELEVLKIESETQQKKWRTEKDGLEKELQSLKFEMSSQQMEHEEAIMTFSDTRLHVDELQQQVAAQIATIDYMEVELESLRKEKEFEVSNLTKGNESFQESSDKKDHELGVLGVELRMTNTLLVSERSKSSKLQEELDKCKAISRSKEEIMQSEIDALNSDIGELKKRLIQLIRDKDQLWQEKDRMEFERKLKSLETWMDSSEVTNCLGCGSEFSILLRKHHCRLCGRIFCHSCCDHWVLTPHYSQKVRVCSGCLMSNSQLEQTSDSGQDQDTSSDFLDSVEIPVKRSTKWLQPNVSDDDEESPGSSPAHSSLVSSNQSFLPSAITTKVSTERQETPKSPDIVAREGSIEVSSQSYQSMDVGIHTLVSPGSSAEKLNSMDVQSGLPTLKQSSSMRDKESSPEQRSDDNFDIITSDEIEEAVLEPLPDTNTIVRETVTTSQILGGEELCGNELWVAAGKNYAVPVLIDLPSTNLSWTFSTQPKGINFTVTYRENLYMGPGEILIPSCKFNSHRTAVSGELKAKKPGLYTLAFENASSRFTAKKISYSLEVSLPES